MMLLALSVAVVVLSVALLVSERSRARLRRAVDERYGPEWVKRQEGRSYTSAERAYAYRLGILIGFERALRVYDDVIDFAGSKPREDMQRARDEAYVASVAAWRAIDQESN